MGTGQPQSGIIAIYKRLGETPLEALKRLRSECPHYESTVLSYAGRLDPMAEGVLAVLVGEENKNREKYLQCDKEYYVDILLGFETDTSDILGLVTSQLENADSSVEKITEILNSFLGKSIQSYPAYSSRPVQGKPLHVWARQGTLQQIVVPKQEVNIYSIELLTKYSFLISELKSYIHENIDLVKGDFRQDKILKRWDMVFENIKQKECTAIRIKVLCSSGTYLRMLAHDFGRKLGFGALALHIKRTKVGNITEDDCIV